MNETYRKTINSLYDEIDSYNNISFADEIHFYDRIKMGDIEFIKKTVMSESFSQKRVPITKLSEDPIRNARYHLIVLASMISRFCVEAGLNMREAYSLSDQYIRIADETKTIQQFDELARKLVFDFTKRMKRLKTEMVYSKNIVTCIDYIHTHLYDKVTIEEVAKHCKLHPSYLSRLFKEETGMGISDYVRHEKIDLAKSMLQHSEINYADIAHKLGFSSQSHFGKVFRQMEGMTPKEYRDQHFYRMIGEENV